MVNGGDQDVPEKRPCQKGAFYCIMGKNHKKEGTPWETQSAF